MMTARARQMRQPPLFDLPENPDHDPVRNGPCRTCGATRPATFDGPMFTEPVSLECSACNRKTIDLLMDAVRRGDRAEFDRIYRTRHYPYHPRPRRRREKNP